MAHEYLKCKHCGTVQRSKEDTSIQRLFDEMPCANLHCGAKGLEDYEVSIGKSDVGNARARALAQRMANHGQAATWILGKVTYNYVERKNGTTTYREQSCMNRDIKAALVRLATGTQLPIDVNNRQHFHDGGKYRGDNLPIRDVKHATVYYKEYGILSSSKGWEVNLSSERLVVGSCGEIYYSSLHYRPGHWWVFNATVGRMGWRQFALRP